MKEALRYQNNAKEILKSVPVHLVDVDFALGAGVDLQLDPAATSLLNQLFELLSRFNDLDFRTFKSHLTMNL